MRTRDPRIARALFWDSLVLLLLSCFELFIRLDAMWGPLKMFILMAVGEAIPLVKVFTYVDFTVFYAPLYMLGCVVLSLWTLCSRRTRRVCLMMLLPAAALTAAGFLLKQTIFAEPLRTLKLLCLTVLLFLCLLHLLVPRARRKPQPIDSFIISRRRSERRRAA